MSHFTASRIASSETESITSTVLSVNIEKTSIAPYLFSASFANFSICSSCSIWFEYPGFNRIKVKTLSESE